MQPRAFVSGAVLFGLRKILWQDAKMSVSGSILVG